MPWGNRYPILANEDTSSKFVTTIHAVNSGILKLSVLTPVLIVYRGTCNSFTFLKHIRSFVFRRVSQSEKWQRSGASGMKMPDQLEIADKFGSRLGIEYGVAYKLDRLQPARIVLTHIHFNPWETLNRFHVDHDG